MKHKTNVSVALEGFLMTANYCWLNRTVTIHLIRYLGQYKQLVSHIAEKIQAHSTLVWHHARTLNNPADIESCRDEVSSPAPLGIRSEWSTDKERWSPDIGTVLEDSLAEAEARHDFCAVAVVVADEINVFRGKLLENS